MSIYVRNYRNERDLEGIRALLVAGRKATNGSYYVHTGDLNWWLFYPPDENLRRETIYLWEDDRGLFAWVLFSPNWRTFDVFVRPEARGSQQAARVYAWAAERAIDLVRDQGGKDARSMWILERDEVVSELLEDNGFNPVDDYIHVMERSLDGRLPEPNLPPGFHMRSIAGEDEAGQRAAVSYAAFGSHLPFDRYVQRYLSFMRSPVYNRKLDLVTVAPDGRLTSFCICWLDPVNEVGLFEPLGTHPDFRRRGLGLAVMLAGLRRMQAHGMRTAIVCAAHDNLAAQKLYASAGFRVAHKLCTYAKKVDQREMGKLKSKATPEQAWDQADLWAELT